MDSLEILNRISTAGFFSFGSKLSSSKNPLFLPVLSMKSASNMKHFDMICCSTEAQSFHGVFVDDPEVKSLRGGDIFSETSSSKSDVDYLGESTKGDLNVKQEHLQAFSYKNLAPFEGPIEEIARLEAQEAETLLNELGIQDPFSTRHSPRGIFCSRTLNLRSISAVGYDMDYTLIQYNVMAWEGRAYDYGMANLRGMGFPVDGLQFDPDLVIRGLIMDKEKGNLVKADRFGYVKRAMHGTKMLSTRAVSEMYGRELVDLRKESRWEFLNTLFSVSEAVMYMQMVDRLDDGVIPLELGPLDYKGLYKAVAKALFRAHVEGQLKSEIMAEPERFVIPDPELPLALLDQKEAGKQLLLITNSDYHYTNKMMQHAFNRFLPNGMDWTDLFEMVIVSARKPEFFQMSHPMYEVVTNDGLMRPCFKAHPGGLYSGGSAQFVEKSLNIHGDEILYVGDHIYTDVSQSKVHLRWRTALICPELEQEFRALIHSRHHRTALIELMNQKEVVGDLFNQLRLALQRRTKGRPAQTLAATNMDDQELAESMQKLLIVMQRLDEKIAPMLEADGELFNKRWGYLSRAGLWDKSHLTKQIEKFVLAHEFTPSLFLERFLLKYTLNFLFADMPTYIHLGFQTSYTIRHSCISGQGSRRSRMTSIPIVHPISTIILKPTR
ncbi:cytosolic purine 5'-nucleotidase isoform X1 [Amborella trichopoda]|uniref:cytosolic purine 5'-nucleotidase isoform X1 n=1 Tax=Amborella trichopoda TaxID=13333 RepID=UPI0009BDEFD6|nr:cytosolic purine 5'-nucleotidase isoform X1 [Amborella trichopoda]|eukprot:XP_020520497.1 cytosolic purine 5'-nucleotidase isoform X1 [Amborella trichopoda]